MPTLPSFGSVSGLPSLPLPPTTSILRPSSGQPAPPPGVEAAPPIFRSYSGLGDTTPPPAPAPAEESTGLAYYWYVLIVILFLLALGGGYYFMKKKLYK